MSDLITDAKKYIRLHKNTSTISGLQSKALLEGFLVELEQTQKELQGYKEEINNLKRKRSKGEINEAYAKTIETDKETISKLKAKNNQLQQRLSSSMGRNSQLNEVVEAAELVSVESSTRNKHLVEVRIMGVENLLKTLEKLNK